MTNYDNLAARIEQHALKHGNDEDAIMAILGYEVATHGRLGLACREHGERHWISLPSFRNAWDAEIWLDKAKGRFVKIEESLDGEWTATYTRGAPSRRGVGKSMSLGAAMWAAFVRCEGRSS